MLESGPLVATFMVSMKPIAKLTNTGLYAERVFVRTLFVDADEMVITVNCVYHVLLNLHISFKVPTLSVSDIRRARHPGSGLGAASVWLTNIIKTLCYTVINAVYFTLLTELAQYWRHGSMGNKFVTLVRGICTVYNRKE